MLKKSPHRKSARRTGARADRIIWLSIAHGALVLGGAGVLLPLLPTTPFLLLALFAAGRSSPELKQAMLDHPRFGRLLRDWTAHRIVPIQAKLLTALMLTASWTLLYALGAATVLLAGLALGFGLLLLWLLSRPSRPRQTHDPRTQA
ncbi:DUF454 family protein [Wenzhouxiangella marina]|uniref:Uncharacterized protein n=1 Tax=Wenzhouxiangella marina TaxID=1579979 RepID=A0A0K0XZ17_9GAMM|nr:DUF454 family protein [Wenzhouxiangella marina]AKS42933.1 hypothetical protein WM2015_2575 [Wenzhouxiangella marina]MBB6087383.1 hypothetical protein [Wenzhouxiangella marina]